MSILGHDGSNRPEQTVEGEKSEELATLLEFFNDKSLAPYPKRVLRNLESLAHEIRELKKKRLNMLASQMSMEMESSPIDKISSLEIVSQSLADDILILCERLSGRSDNSKLNYGFVRNPEKVKINENPIHFENAEKIEHYQNTSLSKFIAPAD